MNTRQERESRSLSKTYTVLAKAAREKAPVTGWTHNFYRYPARFSPRFAAAAIQEFSQPGDLILDPYMGGGTTVVEGVVAGRRVVGNDLNSLAAFIAKAKVTALSGDDVKAVRCWAEYEVPRFSYWLPAENLTEFIDPLQTRNLGLAKARFIKKVVAAALSTIADLPSLRARKFARCAILRGSMGT
jgi:hypothetical protein